MNLLGNARYSPHSLLTFAYIGGNSRRQSQDTKDEDEASLNVRTINEVNDYAKLGGKLE
jgi:hypothetical protein